MSSGYFARDGEPLTMREWARLFEGVSEGDRGYKRVAGSRIDVDGDDVWVSTVWLGLDHAFTPDTRHIFETMPFGGAHDQEAWRWCSEDHAKLGHIAVVAWLLNEGTEPQQCWGHTGAEDVVDVFPERDARGR